MAKKYVTLNFNEKDENGIEKKRHFRFGTKAGSLFEEELGKKLKEIDFENLSIKEMATMFWASLVWEDKSLTPDKTLDLLDELEQEELVELMNKAFPQSDNPKPINQA